MIEDSVCGRAHGGIMQELEIGCFDLEHVSRENRVCIVIDWIVRCWEGMVLKKMHIWLSWKLVLGLACPILYRLEGGLHPILSVHSLTIGILPVPFLSPLYFLDFGKLTLLVLLLVYSTVSQHNRVEVTYINCHGLQKIRVLL